MERRHNKSKAIRNYMANHPEATSGDVARALKVPRALVYNVKSQAKKKATVNVRPASHAAGNKVDNVLAAARLIHSCGTYQAACEALAMAQEMPICSAKGPSSTLNASPVKWRPVTSMPGSFAVAQPPPS